MAGTIKIRHTPFYAFIREMKTAEKILFFLFFGLLTAWSVMTVLAAEDPAAMVVSTESVAETTQQTVVLEEVKANYREIKQELPAYEQTATFTASLMVPKDYMVLGFIIGQILGWAIFLTAATFVRSWWVYLVYFIYSLYLFISNVSESVGEPAWLFNSLFAMGTLIPAYLFQQEIIRSRFWVRFLVFLAVVSLPFGLVYSGGGWVALHGISASSTGFLIIFVLIMTFFLSNDLPNLIFLASTNSKKKRFRLRAPFLLSFFLILFLIEILLLQREMGWELFTEGDVEIRPIWLLMLAAVVTVFTSQSLWRKYQRLIDSGPFSLGLLGFIMVGVSFIAYEIATGDFLFLHNVERTTMLLFTLTTPFYYFFMVYNFGSLIRKKMAFYPWSMQPRRLMYAFVVLATVLGAFALDASQNNKSRKLMSSSLYNRAGDHALLENDLQAAYGLYRTGVSAARGTVKGNYNLANLELSRLGNWYDAATYFTQACRFIHFPYADLNRGNLEVINRNYEGAIKIWKASQTRSPNPYVANNLGLAYLKEEEPDTAILSLKSAIRSLPEENLFYANLSTVYREYNNPEYAGITLRKGLEAGKPNPVILTNAFYHNLTQRDDTIALDDAILDRLDSTSSFPARINAAMYRIRSSNYPAARGLLDKLISQTESGDILLLDAMLKFRSGQIDIALSRIEYINEKFPELRIYLNHYLGLAYFAQGVPEMAAAYFKQSADAGSAEDLLNEARMLIDIGEHDTAFVRLTKARAKVLDSYSEISKEIAMLQLARGLYEFAQVETDLSQLKPAELARVVRYAGQQDNLPVALDFARKWINADSSDIRPYIEMGRIGIRLKDPLTLENLRAGYRLDSNNLNLQIEIARALLSQGDQNESRQLARKLLNRAPNDFETRRLQVDLALADGDTNLALNLLDKMHAEKPLDQDVIMKRGQIYLAAGQNIAGQSFVFKAIDYNLRNAGYWELLAWFEQGIGRLYDSGNAADNAIQLTRDPEKKALLEQQFAEVLRIYREQITVF